MFPRVPASLPAIVLSTVLVWATGIPVDTVASRYGEVVGSLPSFHFPHVSVDLLREMFSPAVTIAILAGIESLLSAVVADSMSGTRHRPNAELMAQGIANLTCPFFGGIPATGAVARTATSIRSGAVSPLTGIIHAVTLLVFTLFLGKFAGLIPMATLGALLILIAFNMAEWGLFFKLFRCPKSDVAILITTFSLTVLIDLTVAIQAGVALSAFLFLHRMSNVSKMELITQKGPSQYELFDPRTIPASVEVFEVYGPMFFGVVDTFKRSMQFLDHKPAVLILSPTSLE